MTVQEAKDFLNRGYRSRERIKVKEERIDEWIRRAESSFILQARGLEGSNT